TSETLDVFPVGITSVPVDPAAGEFLRGSARLEIPLLALLGLNRYLRRVLPLDQDNIAGAALDHLALDRLHPDTAGRAILADAVQEDAAITRGVLARRPGLFAPFELGDQVIILVFLLRDEPAKDLARDMDHPIVHREDSFRIVVLPLALEPGVKAAQVLAVEELDGAVLVVGKAGWTGTDQDRGRKHETEKDGPVHG